ncbi:hypothetical protein AB0451_39390 [Streptomyces sp. NPDC052000]|uniref:hypothetical protein n=1 Tax=Streptomyces sp. NPDC052000 TaxID=3155676 RepID=UPI00344B4BC9
MSNGGWSNSLTTSLTLPTGALTGARIVEDGTTDTILMYDASGALIASIAATAGTDGFGNAYPAGISASSGVISQSIVLVYNGTPAAGNLIASIASAAGSDSFGNKYEQGIITYKPAGLNLGVYAALTQGTVQLGNLSNSVGPDFSNSAEIDAQVSNVVGSSFVRLLSPHNDSVGDVVPAPLWLTVGQSGATTGALNAPYAMISSDTQLSPVDCLISGTVIKDIGFDTRATWQTPTAASGWTVGNLKYRFDALDNVVWTGYIAQNTGASGAGGAVSTVAVPAAYRPATAYAVPCAWTSSSVVCKGAGTMVFNTNGTISVLWPNTTANNDRFQISASIPLGHLS